MRVRALIAFVLLVASIPAWAATVEVQVVDSEFTPDPTVNVGDTVRWVWNAGMLHNVRSAPWEAVAFNSGYKSGNGPTFELTFVTPGVIDYYCDLHAFPDTTSQTISGMAGRITVVPEPVGLAMAAPAVMLLVRRRRASRA
jgi:plastocyanin